MIYTIKKNNLHLSIGLRKDLTNLKVLETITSARGSLGLTALGEIFSGKDVFDEF